MSEIIRHGDTCIVEQESSGKTVEAVVHDFKVEDRLTVILNKTVKMSMKWNGRLYEGRMAGLDFVSLGPKVTRTQTTGRG